MVLFFGLETWVLLASMERKLEGTHTGFLRQVMGKKAQQISDMTWETSRTEVVREAAGTQSAMTYIGRRQAIVEQWVALPPIFEVCAGDKV